MEMFNMTTIQETLGNVLKNRINSEIKKQTLNKEEMKNILDLFLAGDRIVTDQYNEIGKLIDFYTTNI
jgi:hypothetical protein